MDKKIIDVSKFNTITDWTSVAKNVDGVIINAGYRGWGTGTLCTDSKFVSNIKGASSVGIPIGIYFVTQAINETEATAEADYVCNLIKPYKIKLPIYFDTEYSSSSTHSGRADKLTSAVRTSCALAFCSRIKTLGYVAGIYASESWFKSMLQFDLLTGYSIWCAKYSSASPSLSKCDAWQYTDRGTITGLSGSVDVSHFYKDYSVPCVTYQMYDFNISDIDRIAYIPMLGSSGETVSSAACRVKWNNRYPDAICNAELFSMATHAPASGVVSEGKAQFLTDAVGAAFVDNKKPVLSYKNNVKAPDWLGAYPCLVRDGKRGFTSIPVGLGGNVARTAFCWNDTKSAIITVQASKGCDLFDFADLIISLGFTTAINLDGGGSTACITPSSSYDQGRKVRGKIGVWLKGGTGNKLSKSASTVSSSGTVSNGSMQQDKTKIKGVTMKVFANGGLKLRASAPSGGVREVLANNSNVSWYGYYCIAGGSKWLYVRASDGRQGYASANYLKEII